MHGAFAGLSLLGMASAFLPPPPTFGFAAIGAAGGQSIVQVVWANPLLRRWIIEQLAATAYGAFSLIYSVHDHHLTPHNNSTFQHENHPLIKESGRDLKKDPENRMLLHNHGGRHTNEYHLGVKRILDFWYNRYASGIVETADEAASKAFVQIKEEIIEGNLKPYTSKAVRPVN